jgi:hypothetical protein
MIKPDRIRCTGHIQNEQEKRRMLKTFFSKKDGNKLLWRPRNRCEYIKLMLDTGSDGVKDIQLVQGQIQVWAGINIHGNFFFTKGRALIDLLSHYRIFEELFPRSWYKVHESSLPI